MRPETEIIFAVLVSNPVKFSSRSPIPGPRCGRLYNRLLLLLLNQLSRVVIKGRDYLFSCDLLLFVQYTYCPLWPVAHSYKLRSPLQPMWDLTIHPFEGYQDLTQSILFGVSILASTPTIEISQFIPLGAQHPCQYST